MPSFNHGRGDGFYDPCDICWSEMSEADRIRCALSESLDPALDRSILEDLRANGTPPGPFLEEMRRPRW